MLGGSSIRGVVVIYRLGECVGVEERVWFVVCDERGLLIGLVGRMYSVGVFCGVEFRYVGGDGCVSGGREG